MNVAVDDPLISALLDPRCYPHPVQQVEVKQTPLSWVLLAGEYAYKIKKPVKFAFVDLSSLELRHRDCLEELRLNRRFAPQLYVDVVAIGGTRQQPKIVADGVAVEYAVRLRRFAPERELAALLERNAVTTGEMAALGSRLARIHATSPVCDRSGSATRALAVAMDNVQELQRAAPAGHEGVAALSDWLSQEWERVGRTADRRCAEGAVRDCHGDLHVDNIVRIDGELTAFDCIEFNAGLRCIDVMSDVAFLLMDLQARNHYELAYAFLNGWLEAGGAYDALRLRRFFMVHRALVRAKVATLGGDGGRANRYLQLASRLKQPSAPVLMITCGLSGSGKTWFSSRVMTQVGAVRIRSDVERQRLARQSPPAAGIYSPEFNTRVYDHLQMQSQSLLQCGECVIVDAAFLKRVERMAFMALAANEGARFVILHCVAPDDELRQRLEARQRAGNDASEADVSVMERQHGYWEPFTESELTAVLQISTAEATNVTAAINHLNGLSSPPSR